MSMFSGFTNQISGWMATKTGAAGHPHEEVDPNAEPHQQQPEQYLPENGAAEMMGDEVGAENVAPQTGGGVSGFAKGLMQKGLSIKENMKEKASAMTPPNLSGIGSNLMGGISNLMPGRKDEEVPTPPEPVPPTDMGGEIVMEGDQQQQYLQE